MTKEELLKENKYLQQRIGKAIEYIREHKFSTLHFHMYSDTLLSILKGEDK